MKSITSGISFIKRTLVFTSLMLAVNFAAVTVVQSLPTQPPTDPLIVDLNQDGIHLGPAGVAVLFDLKGEGQPISMQWTDINGNEAFLALDKNGNGIVDNGTELFTNYNTLQLENIPAPNGFADLAQYDQIALGGNDDGFISAEDEIWEQLYLWLDGNADGISTVGEMHDPSMFNLTLFDTVPKINNRRDGAGNLIPLWSFAQSDEPRGNNKFKMVDVFFKSVTQP